MSRIESYAIRANLQRKTGLALGAEAFFDGSPQIRLAHGSSILIGKRFVALSRDRFNPVGIRGRVTLATLTMNALITIGNDVGMSGCVVCAAREVTIGNGVIVGANVLITDTDFHPINGLRRYAALPSPVPEHTVSIGDNVFIGTGAAVLKGVTIGANSVIGAMSVVTHDIPSNVVAAGNPARVLRNL